MSHPLEWIRERCAELREWFDASDLSLEPWGAPLAFREGDRSLQVVAHVIARDGSDPPRERYLEGATKVLEILAHGHRTFVRTVPEVNIATDFETGSNMIYGYVRFTVTCDEGEWTWPTPDIAVKWVGPADFTELCL